MVQLLGFGSNGSGQLGIGHQDDVSSPTTARLELKHHQSIKKIVAGGKHTLVLSDDGVLLRAGSQTPGCRFVNFGNINNEPIQKHDCSTLTSENGTGLLRYIDCAATWEGSVGVLEDGTVESSGVGRKGELGLGIGVTTANDAKVIPSFPPDGTIVVDISASMSHVVAILSNGHVYGWGAGRKGQLGVPGIFWKPRRITEVQFRATRAVCGKDFTFIVGDPQHGEHMILGSDKWFVITNKPSVLPPWKDIGASWGSIYVLLETGEVLSWGRNDHKQLCPPGFPPVAKVAVGSEHAICLTESGKVIAWGWGEHGNCGPIPTDFGHDSPGFEIKYAGKVMLLGAGCATSWMVVSNLVP
ncbi:RCC1/BLIP-II [Microthyrium microscopicum]|uniref:RCC1/BLIP-II n=1 Tax=Microthyrium microscopicum TaxID=703497 RepID=A0A6A6UN87_9PEZI|nr:RCC1/BLIP-II [Microthyrium microscopicum]